MASGSGFPSCAPRERIPELDVFRGVAFLAVVFQHSLGFFAQMPDIPFADAAIIVMILHFTKFAVPAFVFVSGVTLFYNHYASLNYLGFIRKRTLDILLPYLIWTCLYQYHYSGLPTFSASWLAGFIKMVASGSGAYHLWFVIMIFQFYLVCPVLLLVFRGVRRMASGFKYGPAAAALLLMAAYGALMWASYLYIPENNIKLSPALLQILFIDYRDRNFIYFIFFFFMGGIAGVCITGWRSFVSRSVGWNSFLFPALYTWIGYELLAGSQGGRINLNYSTLLKPSMFLYSASEILLVYGLALVISGNSSLPARFLTFTGKFSYGGYLAHALVLEYAAKYACAVFPGRYLSASALAFALCALGSVAAAFIISLFPYGKALIGPFDPSAGKSLFTAGLH